MLPWCLSREAVAIVLLSGLAGCAAPDPVRLEAVEGRGSEARETARHEDSPDDVLLPLKSVALETIPLATEAVETFLERWLRERGPEHAEIALTLGWFDAFHYRNDALEGGVEIRTHGFPLGILPMAGVHATSDETVIAYLGFHWLWPITERLAFEPSGALAAYDKGDGKELGGVLEFRSGFSFTYRFESGMGLGIGVSHLSHARLHGDRNPGANSILVGWSYSF